MCLRSHDQASGRCSRLKPRRGVDDIAHGQGVTVSRHADGDHRLAGVHCCARGQVERMLSVQLADPLEDTQARPHGTLGIVAVRDGRAEDGHDCVANELLEHATVLFDSPLRLRVVELQLLAYVFRIGPIRACCEADEIHEQDGDELPLLTRRARVFQRRAAAAAEARPCWVRFTAARATTRSLVDGSLNARHRPTSLPLRLGCAKAVACLWTRPWSIAPVRAR